MNQPPGPTYLEMPAGSQVTNWSASIPYSIRGNPFIGMMMDEFGADYAEVTIHVLIPIGPGQGQEEIEASISILTDQPGSVLPHPTDVSA